jgi:hypothetical protein
MCVCMCVRMCDCLCVCLWAGVGSVRTYWLSGDCNPAETIGTYWRKHNPLISFDSVRNNATRCAKAVNSAELDTDLAGKSG